MIEQKALAFANMYGVLGSFINAALTDDDIRLAVEIAEDAFSVVAKKLK